LKNNDENMNDKISDELLEELKKMEGYNPDLGTDKDPRKSSYDEFLHQVENIIIEKIEPPENL
jgi:hypothetical protein